MLKYNINHVKDFSIYDVLKNPRLYFRWMFWIINILFDMVSRHYFITILSYLIEDVG